MEPAASEAGSPLPDESAERRGILLRVAYVGTPFAGFAPQAGPPTVAGELLRALQQLDPTVGAVRGASRTDAGVHALDHPVAFDASTRVPLRGWLLGTRRWLPDAVVVRQAIAVPLGYNPRFDAAAKTYRYLVHCGPVRDPFLRDRAWQLGPLDPRALAEIAGKELEAARGQHRFDAFRSARDTRLDTTRSLETTRAVVLDAALGWEGALLASGPHGNAARPAMDAPVESLRSAPALGGSSPVVALEITGSAFLHNMVRILVGTAVDVARGRLPAGAVGRALATGRRQDAGMTAPACGLYLAAVRLRSA